MDHRKLERFYSIFPWPSDYRTEQGEAYLKRTFDFMEKLINHEWIRELVDGGEVKILELCGGAGFGSLALGSLLKREGLEVDILVTDLRRDVLKKVKGLSRRLGFKGVKTKVLDAREVHKLDSMFDVALLYGLSTPHFSPWDIVKLISSVSFVLDEDGILVVDENDRRYRIFINTGYRWTLAEGDEERTVISFHTGYNPVTGMIKRSYVDLPGLRKPVSMETFMWGVAEIGSLLWVFFKEVSLLHLGGTRYFILARFPRKVISPEELRIPDFLK